MSFEPRFEFTKENIDTYLKEIAKEYRKRVGKGTPAELILIGGASVLINYGFRDMTTDIDALIYAASEMKDVINRVGDRFDLPNGWLNSDFKKTDSYTPKLVQFSVYYKTYSNILTIRTVSSEYLIAMKLRSGRQYKSDFSDVLGILADHKERNSPITIEQIQKAVLDLYGDWNCLPAMSQAFIGDVMQNGHFGDLYAETATEELVTKELLIHFERDYPGVATASNVNEIIRDLKQRRADTEKSTVSFADQLRSAQEKAATLNAQRQAPRSSITREVPEK